MNAPKVRDLDYINFLLATPRVVSATEGARVQPEEPRRAAHDAFTRLLHRLEPATSPLWREAEPLVDRHWSGKHRHVVLGINVVSLVWSDVTHAARAPGTGSRD